MIGLGNVGIVMDLHLVFLQKPCCSVYLNGVIK